MLVEQIEGDVGSDLHYLHINGTVIGDMVGLFIAVIKYLIL
jgi:uncharacterized membrane-anchored protein YjiN (DUF445 family)